MQRLASQQWRQLASTPEIKKSGIPGAGDGLYAKNKVEEGTKIYYFGRYYVDQDDWDRRQEPAA